MELDQTPRPVPVRHSSAMAAACEHMYPGRPGRVRGGGQHRMCPMSPRLKAGHLLALCSSSGCQRTLLVPRGSPPPHLPTSQPPCTHPQQLPGAGEEDGVQVTAHQMPARHGGGCWDGVPQGCELWCWLELREGVPRSLRPTSAAQQQGDPMRHRAGPSALQKPTLPPKPGQP